MADKAVEDQDKKKYKQGTSHFIRCPSVTEKGLTEKDSHALFMNLHEGIKHTKGLNGALYGFEGLDAMSEKEKRKKFGDMDVVMTGFAGLSGSVILAREKYDVLRNRYSASFLEGAKKQERLLWQIPEAAPAGKSDGCSSRSFSENGIAGMYLLSEGGVFAGLWNMGKTAGVGLKIYGRKIPVKQETIEICNFFDVNPYQMFSEGSCLILAENGYRLKCRLLDEGIFSEVIGLTAENNDRVVINGDEQRYLERHYEEALKRIPA